MTNKELKLVGDLVKRLNVATNLITILARSCDDKETIKQIGDYFCGNVPVIYECLEALGDDRKDDLYNMPTKGGIN